MELLSHGKDGDNMVEILKRKLNIKNDDLTTFPGRVEVWSICPYRGNLAEVDREPCQIKGFLTGEESDEFFVYIHPLERTVVLDVSENNDQNEFMKQLLASNN